MLLPLLFLIAAVASPAATSAPSPAATSGSVLGGGWQPVDLRPQEYASFARHEPDGTVSNMSATSQVCDCLPADAASEIQVALARVPSMVVKRDAAPICGIPTSHLIATGAPAGGRQMNFEVFLFRHADTLYAIRYYFKSAAPALADEALMPLLCPKAFTAA
jgi:hypothetical protein